LRLLRWSFAIVKPGGLEQTKQKSLRAAVLMFLQGDVSASPFFRGLPLATCLPTSRYVSEKNIQSSMPKNNQMNKLIEFGENVEGYDFPVLNEREIRAAAGILFLATFISLMYIVFKNNFLPIKYVLTVFLADFLIRVFINPKFSPSLIIGRIIVRNQTPEYVGARQKKFAWIIGVILSAIMFSLIVIVNSYSPITGITCLICLVFLFFESAFGICLGCKFYPLFFKEKVQHCPGEVCIAGSKQEIQKISRTQLLIVVSFITFIFITAWLFHDQFSKQPYDLFGIFGSVNQK
jgi:hypothetical protein